VDAATCIKDNNLNQTCHDHNGRVWRDETSQKVGIARTTEFAEETEVVHERCGA
ncbi:hypothetical protein LSAT2_001136, partial [Lamellibrachia satsuma]